MAAPPVVSDWYARPSHVREVGRLSGVPDSRLHQLIDAVSRAIDNFCNRHIAPAYYSRVVNVDPSACIIRCPDIIAVDSMRISADGINWQSWQPQYAIHRGVKPASQLAALSSAAVVVSEPPGAPLLEITGVWGFSASQDEVGVLAGDISVSQQSVALPAAVEPGDMLIIDSEYLQVMTSAGTAATVRRGCNGTTPSAHSAGAPVFRRTYPSPIVAAATMQAVRIIGDAGTLFTAAATPEVGGWSGITIYPVIRDMLLPYRAIGGMW